MPVISSQLNGIGGILSPVEKGNRGRASPSAPLHSPIRFLFAESSAIDVAACDFARLQRRCPPFTELP